MYFCISEKKRIGANRTNYKNIKNKLNKKKIDKQRIEKNLMALSWPMNRRV